MGSRGRVLTPNHPPPLVMRLNSIRHHWECRSCFLQEYQSPANRVSCTREFLHVALFSAGDTWRTRHSSRHTGLYKPWLGHFIANPDFTHQREPAFDKQHIFLQNLKCPTYKNDYFIFIDCLGDY